MPSSKNFFSYKILEVFGVVSSFFIIIFLLVGNHKSSKVQPLALIPNLIEYIIDIKSGKEQWYLKPCLSQQIDKDNIIIYDYAYKQIPMSEY